MRQISFLCIIRQTHHTCHHPHRVDELGTTNEKWNRNWYIIMSMFGFRTFEKTCGCTAVDMPE